MSALGTILCLLIAVVVVLILFPTLSGGYSKLEKHFVIEDKEEIKNIKEKEEKDND